MATTLLTINAELSLLENVPSDFLSAAALQCTAMKEIVWRSTTPRTDAWGRVLVNLEGKYVSIKNDANIARD